MFDAGGGAPEQALWLTRYVVRQLGQIEAPVEIEARFRDGSVINATWNGRGGYRIFEHRTGAQLAEVLVDPERKFLIDLDTANNGRRLRSDLETTRSLKAYAHFWTQNVLNAWGLVF